MSLRSVEGTGKQIPKGRRPKFPFSCSPKVRSAHVGVSSGSLVQMPRAGCGAGLAEAPGLLSLAATPALVTPEVLGALCCCPGAPGLQELVWVTKAHPGMSQHLLWDSPRCPPGVTRPGAGARVTLSSPSPVLGSRSCLVPVTNSSVTE